MSDIAKRINAEVVLALVDLDLQGDVPARNIGDRVYSLTWPDNRDVKFPCLMVFQREPESRLYGDSAGDVWEFPLVVAVCDQGDLKHTLKGLYLTWRWALIEAFQNASLPAVTEVCKRGIVVQPDVVFDERLPQYQHIETGVVIRVRAYIERA